MSHNVVPSRYWGGEHREFRPACPTKATKGDKGCVCILKSAGSTARKGEIVNYHLCVHRWQSLILTGLLLFWGKKGWGKGVKIDTTPRLHMDVSINMPSEIYSCHCVLYLALSPSNLAVHHMITSNLWMFQGEPMLRLTKSRKQFHIYIWLNYGCFKF